MRPTAPTGAPRYVCVVQWRTTIRSTGGAVPHWRRERLCLRRHAVLVHGDALLLHGDALLIPGDAGRKR